MNGPQRPQVVSEYFARLTKDLSRRFPLADVGENSNNTFHSEYISRDNKRRVVFFVDHTPEHAVTRVTYVLPVSREAAPLFGEDDTMPDTRASFTHMKISAKKTITEFVEEYVAANNLEDWRTEIARVTHNKKVLEHDISIIEEERNTFGVAPVAAQLKRALAYKKAYTNVIVYWKAMRSKLYDAIYNSSLYMTRTSSGRERSSEVRRRTVRRNTSASILPRGSVRRSSNSHVRSGRLTTSPISAGSSSASRKPVGRQSSQSGRTSSSGRVTSSPIASSQRVGRRGSSSEVSSEAIQRRLVLATRRRRRTPDPVPENSDPV